MPHWNSDNLRLLYLLLLYLLLDVKKEIIIIIGML